MSRLPNFEWQYRNSFNNNFNNQLLAGINAGFSLYDRETDTKLYRNIDSETLNPNKISFENINKILDDKDTNYQKGKNLVSGIVDQVNIVGEATEKNLKNIFDISPELKILAIAFLGLLILRK